MSSGSLFESPYVALTEWDPTAGFPFLPPSPPPAPPPAAAPATSETTVTAPMSSAGTGTELDNDTSSRPPEQVTPEQVTPEQDPGTRERADEQDPGTREQAPAQAPEPETRVDRSPERTPGHPTSGLRVRADTDADADADAEERPRSRSRSPAVRSADDGRAEPACADAHADTHADTHTHTHTHTHTLSADGVLEDLAEKEVAVDLPAGNDRRRTAVFRMLLTGGDSSGDSESVVGCACFAHVIAGRACELAPQEMQDLFIMPAYPSDDSATCSMRAGRRVLLAKAARDLIAMDIVLRVTGAKVTIEKGGEDLHVFEDANPFMELGRYVAMSLYDSASKVAGQYRSA